jgi:hypothetical protein
VLALVDRSAGQNDKRKTGVFGYSEASVLALYDAAVVTRIDLVGLSRLPKTITSLRDTPTTAA